jgi:adenosylcobinamide-GDP ribazoletransferase
LLAALQFLTIARVGRRTPSLDEAARAQWLFPAVGLLIGLMLLGVDRAALRALPPASVSVLVVVAWAVVTGALHLDGLADTADGLFGGRDATSRLAIMRDVRAGTYAVVAVVGVLALKWAGLAAVPSQARAEAILLAPCLGRLAMVLCIAAFPYARADGMGAGFRRHSGSAALIGGLFAAAVSVALCGGGGALALAVAALCGLAVGALAYRLVGGVTGDVYGASVEVAEACTLLFIAAVANRGWLEAWLLA